MADNKSSDNPLNLSEVLDRIATTGKKTFTDKDGKAYSSVYVKDLKAWATVVESAILSARDATAIKEDLMVARQQCKDLHDAAQAKQKHTVELEANIEAAKAKYERAKADSQAIIADMQRRVDEAKKGKLDAELSKAASAAELQAAEKQLASPAGTYDAEFATKVNAQILALKGDVKLAGDQIASHKAALSAANAHLDKVHKDNAAVAKELQQAQADAANFKRQLAALKVVNADFLDVSTVDFEGLVRVFGDKGVIKLREALEVPVFDVRGQVQRLTGFFSVVTRYFFKHLKPMMGVLDHALKVMKQGGSTWSAILAPWVNSLLKDIVSLQMKSVSEYADSLHARIEKVQLLPPSMPVLDKAAAIPLPQPTWQEVLEERKFQLKTASVRAQSKMAAALRKLKNGVAASTAALDQYVGQPLRRFSAGVAASAKRSWSTARTAVRHAVIFMTAFWLSFNRDTRVSTDIDPDTGTTDIQLESVDPGLD